MRTLLIVGETAGILMSLEVHSETEREAIVDPLLIYDMAL